MHRVMVLFSILRAGHPGVFLVNKSQMLVRCQCNCLSPAVTFTDACV